MHPLITAAAEHRAALQRPPLSAFLANQPI
jgi:hypothetical protein